MFKDLQVTLYDFFGYLLPGSVVALALVVAFWSILWPSATLVILTLPSLIMAVLILASYLSGHLAQAMSNILEKLSTASQRYSEQTSLSKELEKALRASVAKHFGEAVGQIAPEELYLLCDQALLNAGSLGEREIFIYREGFYRGNSVALAFLALSLFLRIIHSPATILIAQRIIELHRSQLGLAAVFVAFGAWLAYRRYLRFRQYKFTTCYLRFLSLWASLPAMEKRRNVNT